MKQILPILVIALLSQLGLHAQSFTINPSPVIEMGIQSDDFEGIGKSFITNGFPVVKNVTWTRNVVEISEGWLTAVCDKNQCYEPPTGSESFSFGPNEEAPLDVHAYPQGNDGSAVVEIVVADDTNGDNNVSALYYFNTQPSSTRNLTRQPVKVYPNPSNGLFSIKGLKQIGQVEVYGLTGSKVRSFQYGDGQWYDITDLPRGTYLVRLIDRSGQQLVTKMINKM
jgi:hypothetical protein